MTFLFFASLVIVFYTYAGYPIGIALLARSRTQPRQRALQAGHATVILPIHNGFAMLPSKMESLRAVDASLVNEIIVICDGCTDDSATWLQTWDDVRVKTIVLPEQTGKATALRRGMAAATSEFLVFIDIRPEITGAAIQELLNNFADPSVGCVAGELRIRDTEATHATAGVGGLYWRYEQWIRNNEAAVDSPVGVYGGFYAIRNSLATAPPDGLILDDMFQPLSIIRQGYRSVVDAHAIVYDRWPATARGEFQRKVRTLAGNFQLIAVAPWILTTKNRVLIQLVSHKLLRLVVPYCLVLMLLTSCILATHSVPWMATACLQATIWALALLALQFRLPVVGKAAAACGALLILNAAAVWALWVYLFTPGPLWTIWTATAEPTSRKIPSPLV